MIQVLVQVSAGSSDRRIYNEPSLEYLETRHGALLYPYPYGFIVGTSAADGDCVDCYILTSDPLTAGDIVMCEPIGLLLQDEDEEMDHKVLAAIPGQSVLLGSEILQELQEFITKGFSEYPGVHVRVGPILSREAALEYILQASPIKD